MKSLGNCFTKRWKAIAAFVTCLVVVFSAAGSVSAASPNIIVVVHYCPNV